MMYGYKPKSDDKEYIKYCDSVEAQRKAANPNKDMKEFLTERRQRLDGILRANFSSYVQAHGYIKPGTQKKLRDVSYIKTPGEENAMRAMIQDESKFVAANAVMIGHAREEFWKNKQGGVKDGKPMDFNTFTDITREFLVASSALTEKKEGKETKPGLDTTRDTSKGYARRLGDDKHKPTGRGYYE